jgi:transcriptional regulator with XRE-family HTH domain
MLGMSPMLLTPGPSAGEGSQFVARMRDWQRARGDNDRAFAAHLGISRSYLNHLYKGRRRVSMAIAQRVMAERPEFQLLLADDLREAPGRGPYHHGGSLDGAP